MVPWSAFPGACLMCSIAQVVFKWQWFNWTCKHPFGWKSPHDWPESLAIKLAAICDI